MKKIYTGVGSRETPLNIQKLMTTLAVTLGRQGWSLRSGKAIGADTAFEIGCDQVNGVKEIFRPYRVPDWCYQEVAKYLDEKQKGWFYSTRNTDYVKSLLARNMQQVLGRDGDNPSKFVILWTPTEDPCSPNAGGTRFAARCAQAHNIPIFNLKNKDTVDRINKFLNKN